MVDGRDQFSSLVWRFGSPHQWRCELRHDAKVSHMPHFTIGGSRSGHSQEGWRTYFPGAFRSPRSGVASGSLALSFDMQIDDKETSGPILTFASHCNGHLCEC